MPRPRVRLDAPTEPPPVPDWWAAEFAKRQHHLRTIILRWLARAGRGLSVQEIKSSTGSYSSAEKDHALISLVAEGRLVVYEQRDRVSLNQWIPQDSSPSTRTYTYYDIAERHHANAERE